MTRSLDLIYLQGDLPKKKGKHNNDNNNAHLAIKMAFLLYLAQSKSPFKMRVSDHTLHPGVYISTKNQNYSVMDLEMTKLFRNKISIFYWPLNKRRTFFKYSWMNVYTST